jgi:hypothetical protein
MNEALAGTILAKLVIGAARNKRQVSPGCLSLKKLNWRTHQELNLKPADP